MQDLKQIILRRLKKMDAEAQKGKRRKPFSGGYSGPPLRYGRYWLGLQLEDEGICSRSTLMRWLREEPFKATAPAIQFILALLGLHIVTKET